MEYRTDADFKAVAGTVPVYCAHDEIVSIDKLIPNPHNPNDHPEDQITLLAEIIEATGWRAPITVSTSSGYIVKGHGRYQAAKSKGWPSVPVDYQNYASEAEEYADLIADNRIAELADMNQRKLAEIFEGIDLDDIPIELTGYTEEEVDKLTALLNDALDEEGLGDPDEVPEAGDKEPVSRSGDLWVLDGHRLICGDATCKEDVEKLLGGVRASMLLTDPPYNVSYVGKSKDALTIQNDSMSSDEFQRFLEKAFTAANENMKPGAAFYIWYASREVLPVEMACRNTEWEVRQTLIWNKNSMVLGRQDYQWKHEPCLYGWKAGAPHTWKNDRSQTTVLDFDRPTVNKEHPTMKPVALFEYLIRNNTKPGDVVLDIFAGSGTTMIACAASGRRAALVELDPKYADVIVKRYIRTTGSDNVQLIRDGKEVDRDYYKDIFAE